MIKGEFIKTSAGSIIQGRFVCGGNARGKMHVNVTKVTRFPEMGSGSSPRRHGDTEAGE
jgi:hypothetical protein